MPRMDAGLPHEIYCSIGLHPWHIQEFNAENCLKKVEEFAAFKQVLAIGETGLDRKIQTPIEIQQSVFMEHIGISEKMSKPLVIHCIKAYSDIMQIRKSKRWKMHWMFHWFNENLAIANEFINMNCYLSFGRSLFHPNGRNADVFRSLPLEYIFLETDDAEVTIENVYKKAAELKNISINELKQKINENFNKVFLQNSEFYNK